MAHQQKRAHKQRTLGEGGRVDAHPAFPLAPRACSVTLKFSEIPSLKFGLLCVKAKIMLSSSEFNLHLISSCGVVVFFFCLLRGQPHFPDVNHCVLDFRTKCHREPPKKVGSQSPSEHLVGFVPGTFRLLLQCLNPQDHSPQTWY